MKSDCATSAINALMLDLDGTLVDSAPDLMRVLNLTLLQLNRSTLELDQVIAMIGNGIPSLVEQGLDQTGGVESSDQLSEAVKICVQYYSETPVADSTLYSGVKETLEILQGGGFKLAVCTNKPEALARLVLQELTIDRYFVAVVGGDTTDVKKPDAKHLTFTMEKMGCSHSTTVMVGDSANDIIAANNAGVPAVLVSYGYNLLPHSELKISWVIDHFSDILNLDLNNPEKAFPC